MSKEQNVAAQQRMGEAINTGNLNALDDVLSPDVVDHDPAPDQGPGTEGCKQFFTTMRTAIPDLHVEVEHLVADDENVASAYRITGTHQGEFQGVAATGRCIDARGVQISRFVDGKVSERWGSSDEAGIMNQLAAPPADDRWGQTWSSEPSAWSVTN
jgi:steroid delta-isomerase-like uncharacterized protein